MFQTEKSYKCVTIFLKVKMLPSYNNYSYTSYQLLLNSLLYCLTFLLLCTNNNNKDDAIGVRAQESNEAAAWALPAVKAN